MKRWAKGSGNTTSDLEVHLTSVTCRSTLLLFLRRLTRLRLVGRRAEYTPHLRLCKANHDDVERKMPKMGAISVGPQIKRIETDKSVRIRH